MLQNIRKNSQGIVAKVIIGLIVGSFALFGVQSILVGSGVNNIAEIDGEGISAVDLQQAINIQKRRMLNALGDQVDPSMLDDSTLQGPALEGLIREKLYVLRAESQGLAVSEDVLNSRIASDPNFAIDGQFSPELYQNVLSQNGFSPSMYQRLLTTDTLTRQLRTGLAASEFSTPMEVSLAARYSQEKRDIRYLTIPQESFRAALTPDQAQIEAYYEEHLESFQSSEAVSLEYLDVQIEDFFAEVSEEELREEYESRLEDMATLEERMVSHILLETSSDLDDQAAQARLLELKAQLDAGGQFSQLAREHSMDIGSADFGGDLGFTQGDAFPEAMEAEIARLAVNEISDPVQTDAGWHLITVTEIVAGGVPEFEEVREEITAQIQAQNARLTMIKQVEALRDIAFNAVDLKDPADELGLEVQASGRMERGSTTGLFQYPAVVSAAFSDEVLIDGHNSEVIEVAENHFVTIRLKEHYPAQALPLADVRIDIINAVIADSATAAAEAMADSLLAKLHAGSSVETVALGAGYEWQVELGLLPESGALPEAGMRRVFQLPALADESQFDYVTIPGGDILLFELYRVSIGDAGKLPPQRAEQLGQRVAGELGGEIDGQYLSALREQAEIDIL